MGWGEPEVRVCAMAKGTTDEDGNAEIPAAVVGNSREERIRARRMRIQMRIDEQRALEAGVSKQGSKVEEPEGPQRQMLDSSALLGKIKREGDVAIDMVRKLGDVSESKRRDAEEELRRNLRTKLLGEAEQSARRNATVAMRWADLYEMTGAKTLEEELKKQQLACERIIMSKDMLIAEFREQLRVKDEEYVNAIKSQANDIDAMIGHMHKQFDDLQMSYRTELEVIEQAFLQERSELMNGNKSEIDALFEKRADLELEFVKRMQERNEDYEERLKTLRQRDAEDYNILKIRLETDIQNLEQHLETMRATYQLNTEKLEYNYRVLVERDVENQHTINAQKRKIAKQREMLSLLKDRYRETDAKFAEENQRLSKEYRNISERYKELQIKFRRFEKTDAEQYSKIWRMNADRVKGVVKELLEADKVINEQQLGLPWKAPDESVFTEPSTTVSIFDGDRSINARKELLSREAFQGACQDPAMLDVFKRLDVRADYLVEAKVRKALSLAENIDDSERLYLRVTSIFKSVAVFDMDGVRRLLKYLTSNTPSGPVSIKEDEYTLALETFMIDRKMEAMGSREAQASKPAPRNELEALKERRRMEDKSYWDRMTNIVSEDRAKVLKRLSTDLEKYHAILAGRLSSLEEVRDLRQQNDELKGLLNQYLSSKVNEELLIPPTMLM